MAVHYVTAALRKLHLVVSDIVLKNKFVIKRYEIVLYTCNIWYLNEINETND